MYRLVTSRASIPQTHRFSHNSQSKHTVSLSTLAQQNPILHSSNRIVTSGLLSGIYGRGLTTPSATTPTVSANVVSTQTREFQTSAPAQQQQTQDYNNEVAQDFFASEAPQANQYSPNNPEPTFRIFKPNNDPLKGSAISWKYSYRFKCVFVDAAKQKGPKLRPGEKGSQFDWASKLTVKFSVGELGKMLTVFNGTEQEVSLIHQIESGGVKSVTTCKITQPTTNFPQYSIKLGKKVGDGDPLFFQIFLDKSEAVVMVEFLRLAIRSGLGFL